MNYLLTITAAILKSAVTQKFLTNLVVVLLEGLAKKTENKIDDQVVDIVKKAADSAPYGGNLYDKVKTTK